MTQDEGSLKKLTPLVLDFAQAMGEDPVNAAEAVNKALNGQMRGLKSLGINMVYTGDKASMLTKIMGALSDKVGGQATAALTDEERALRGVQVSIDETKDSWGKFALTIAGLAIGKGTGGKSRLADNLDFRSWEMKKMAEESGSFGERISKNFKWLFTSLRSDYDKEQMEKMWEQMAEGKTTLRDLSKMKPNFVTPGAGGKGYDPYQDAQDSMDATKENVNYQNQATAYLIKLRTDMTDKYGDLLLTNIDSTDKANKETLAAINKEIEYRKKATDEQKKQTDERIKGTEDELNAMADGFKAEMKFIEDEKKAREDAVKVQMEIDSEMMDAAMALDVATADRENEMYKKILTERKERNGVTMNIELTDAKSLLDQKVITQEEYEKQVADIKKKYYDKDLADNKVITDKIKQEWDKRLNAASDIASTMYDFGKMLNDRAMSDLDKKHEYELKLAGNNADKKAEADKKYDAARKKIMQKQAIEDKAMSIFKATLNFAQALVAALTVPPPASFVFEAITAALAGIQVGIVAATPIPAFAKGTKSAKKGLAWIGEKGKELIFGPDGSVGMSPGTASLMQMKGGERIVSNRETEILMRTAKGADDQHSKRLMEQMHQDNRDLINTIRNKKEVYFDEHGRKIAEREGAYFKNYRTKKITG